MIHALGYSHTTFSASKPGRLCRGRERWIEPLEDEEAQSIERLVISGACFTDDSARDALRGINHSKVELASLINTLFPKKTLLAFMEDGHPADIPEDAVNVEVYIGYRAGGQHEEPLVRWRKGIRGLRAIRGLLGDDPETDPIRGFAVVQSNEVEESLDDLLYNLTGLSCLDSPPARFQPSALAPLIDLTGTVILLHRDKHGPSLGVYSKESIRTEGRLESLCEKTETLLVKFAIPPMLARWDRALSEARTEWESSKEEPFPVPVSAEPSHWDGRRRRRNRREGRGKKDNAAVRNKAGAEVASADEQEAVEAGASQEPASEPQTSEALESEEILESMEILTVEDVPNEPPVEVLEPTETGEVPLLEEEEVVSDSEAESAVETAQEDEAIEDTVSD